MHPKLSTFGGLKEGDLYIERPADRALLSALQNGDYAYVLSSRQTGKTSLMSRTVRRLREEGCRCAKIDLGGIGSSADPDQWYFALAMEIAEAAGCKDTFVEDHFTQSRGRTVIQRFIWFLRDVVAQSARPLIVFIDEIEGFLKLPIRVTDDFLAAIRSCYNDRDREPLYRRLSFCLLGVCTPNELIRDERRTPFNVARSIDLEDFAWSDVSSGFLPVFGEPTPQTDETLRQIYHWTGGHPYLTHRIVQAVHQRQREGTELSQAAVDRTVQELFLRGIGREKENFLEVERRLSLGQAHRVHRRLLLYKSILRGESIPARGQDLIQLELRLTGLVREVRGSGEGPLLAVRNRVFAALFDEAWTPKISPAKFEPALWMKEHIERWIELGRKDAFVLRGEELFEAKKWAALQSQLEPSCREFLEASRRVDDRERSLRLNSLLFMTLWASCASFLLTPLLLDYWHQCSYPGLEVIKYLYAIPFLLALPAGIVTDRNQVKSAKAILYGLILKLIGSCLLLSDLYIKNFQLAIFSVSLMVIGQIIIRPQPAVLLGLLYPRSDNRADLAFISFYLFVNLGALLGPLCGAAMYRQYNWVGAIGTMAGALAIALYGFAVSYPAFSKLSFPARSEIYELPLPRRRRYYSLLLLGCTLVIFWSSFYGFGDFLSAHLTSSPELRSLATQFGTGNLLLQGLSSDAITPIFIMLLSPIFTGFVRLMRHWKKEPDVPTKLFIGMFFISTLQLAAIIYTPEKEHINILWFYIILSVSELLVVPASLFATSALSNSQTLFSMMSANYLTAGVGAFLATSLATSSRLEFGILAAVSAIVALGWLVRRRQWRGAYQQLDYEWRNLPNSEQQSAQKLAGSMGSDRE